MMEGWLCTSGRIPVGCLAWWELWERVQAAAGRRAICIWRSGQKGRPGGAVFSDRMLWIQAKPCAARDSGFPVYFLCRLCCRWWSLVPVSGSDPGGGGVAENRWGSSGAGVWIYPHSLSILRQKSLPVVAWWRRRGWRKSGGGSFGKPPPKFQKRKQETLSLIPPDDFVICWL